MAYDELIGAQAGEEAGPGDGRDRFAGVERLEALPPRSASLSGRDSFPNASASNACRNACPAAAA